MKKVLIVLALAAAASFAFDSVRIEGLTTVPGTDDMLQYDDGTPYWIIYNAKAYGTWFDVQDFSSSAGGFEVESVEWWFYHHSSLPWDTEDATLELWTSNEDNSAPGEKKKDDVVEGVVSDAATVVTYDPPIALPRNFWAVFNADAHSSEGYPSPLSDKTANSTGVDHTFATGDFLVWDPITAAEINVDLIVRVSGNFTEALDDESWGTIKGLYR